jgi:hypothetical protein
VSMPESLNAPKQDSTLEQEPMRLRDLLSGLQSRHEAAADFIQRIDPGIGDAIRAMAAHRQIRPEDFVAEALMQFALDAADAAWRIAVEERADSNSDPEAVLLGHLLDKIMRLRLQAELMIASEGGASNAPLASRRIGHPYRAK